MSCPQPVEEYSESGDCGLVRGLLFSRTVAEVVNGWVLGSDLARFSKSVSSSPLGLRVFEDITK